jgi:hypothetical protein
MMNDECVTQRYSEKALRFTEGRDGEKLKMAENVK